MTRDGVRALRSSLCCSLNLVFWRKCLETPHGSLYWALRERGCQLLLKGRNLKGWGGNPSFLLSMTTPPPALRWKIHSQRREVVSCRFSEEEEAFEGTKLCMQANRFGSSELPHANLSLHTPAQACAGCQQLVLPVSCRLTEWGKTCKIAVQCNFREGGRRGAGKLFFWSLKILCLDQAGSFHIWAGDAYWKENNAAVPKKIVKFFCVSSGTSWILLPLGKWSRLMYKEYKKLKDKSVSLK